jgi:hypothetical protein
MIRGRTKHKKPLRNGIPHLSMFPGVTFDKSPCRWRKPWKAVIGINGRQTNLGRFATEGAAHASYVEALLNYPTDHPNVTL